MRHVLTKDKGVHNVAIMWDSPFEAAQVAPTLKNEVNRTRATRDATQGSHSGGNNQRWYGAPTFDEAAKRIKSGWAEGASRLEEIATKQIDLQSVRRRRTRSDQGDEIDMQAVWRGDLSRAWTRTRRQMRSGGVRTVTLVCQLVASANVSSDDLFWRGASALKLADELTTAGYNVAIYAVCTTRDSGASKRINTAQFTEIKASDMPLDLSALAALTAMPAYFRSTMFAGICVAADLAGDDADSGYGCPLYSGAQEAAASLGLENAFFQGNITDKEQAEKWIDSVLEQIEAPQLQAA